LLSGLVGEIIGVGMVAGVGVGGGSRLVLDIKIGANTSADVDVVLADALSIVEVSIVEIVVVAGN